MSKSLPESEAVLKRVSSSRLPAFLSLLSLLPASARARPSHTLPFALASGEGWD